MLTPAQCEDELRRLSKKLEERTDALAGLLMEAAEADAIYRTGYAVALLHSDAKTVAEREAEAVVAMEEELMDRRTKEAVADACREAVRSLRDQLSAVQSANANVRYQAGLS